MIRRPAATTTMTTTTTMVMAALRIARGALLHEPVGRYSTLLFLPCQLQTSARLRTPGQRFFLVYDWLA